MWGCQLVVNWFGTKQIPLTLSRPSGQFQEHTIYLKLLPALLFADFLDWALASSSVIEISIK